MWQVVRIVFAALGLAVFAGSAVLIGYGLAIGVGAVSVLSSAMTAVCGVSVALQALFLWE